MKIGEFNLPNLLICSPVHKTFTFNFFKTIDKRKEKVYNSIKERRKDLIKMKKNKLVYVVGTKLFYNIRVFENFNNAYEYFKKCITTEISHCEHLTDKQKEQAFNEFNYYCSFFEKQNHDIFTSTTSYKVENVFKKKVTYYFSTEILER